MKHCKNCGSKIKPDSKFCEDCGFKLIITQIIEDKEGHIKKAEEIIESDSPIPLPKKLTLMPGEKLLESHMDFYVSNKRLIKHLPSMFSTKTEDYHYRHIKGVQEDDYRPYLKAGLIIGIVLLLMGSAINNFFIIVLGAISIIIAFWYKKIDMVVMHMDGGHIRVPNIKSKSGKKVANVLRTQLYNK